MTGVSNSKLEMLIRTEGGDVVRREVDHVIESFEINGRQVPVAKNPVLHDGEEVFQVLGSAIPLVVKVR